MKIIGYQHRLVSVPVEYSVVSSVRESNEIAFVLLDILTDEGIKGISYAQGFHLHGCKAIQSCLDLVMSILIGEDPTQIEKIWQMMYQAIKLLGRQGLAVFALSMVDIALWDILGKSLQQPLYQLFGGKKTKLEAYASDALWLIPPVEAAKQAEKLVQQGFTTIKMRLGRKAIKEDIKALAEIRNAVGYNIEILADVNQGWKLAQTVNICKQLGVYKLGWLEEPIDADDSEGYSELMNQIDIPIATGENLYSTHAFRHFLQLRSASVYTPDLQRIGGFTGWKRVRGLLESFNVSYSLHLFPEFSSHMMASAKRSQKLEWMSWASPLFAEPLVCNKGVIEVSDKPGLGMSWDEDVIRKFSL